MHWQTIHTDSQITAIHAALLPTERHGVVLYFGDWAFSGTETTEFHGITEGRLFRMAPNLVEDQRIAPIEGVSPTTDAFCCGQAFLADGRLLAAGGTQGWAQQHLLHPDHYDGERACWIYHPRANGWVRVQDLNFQPGSNSIGGGRWYPTLVTLGNGEVFAAGGHPSVDDTYQGRHNNNTPERYSPGADQWALMTFHETSPNRTETDGYPRYHLMPNGLLFFDTAGRDVDFDGAEIDLANTSNGDLSNERLFDPVAGVWTGPGIDNLETLPNFYAIGSEATSVLLPLMPPNYQPRVLACNSGHDTAFYIDVEGWQTTAPRTGSAAGRPRDNACATLLPTGQVLVTGGWPGNAGANNLNDAVLQAELYTPGINWEAGDFSNTDDEEWITIEEASLNRRGYHSTALLLPDGRVWHGGSTTAAEARNRNIDVFVPDYVSATGRPTITSCPDSISYGMPFPVDTPQANSIVRVALIRCGSVTHSFNSDQRYVVLNFNVADANTLIVQSPPHGNVAPPGYYMLFLIDNQDRVCELAAFIRVAKQKLVTSANNSTFSIHEVEALGTPALFPDALFVVADGFLPSEVTTPTYQLRWSNGGPVPGVTATFGAPKFEAGANQADLAQRIAYPVQIRFDNTAAFEEIPNDQDFRRMIFTAHMGPFAYALTLQLSKNPNPRMSDGDPPWLSIDLRVFKTNPGDSPTAGIVHPAAGQGAGGAYGYIQDILAAYNAWEGGGHPFDGLPTDQADNRLELGTNDMNGDPVFNYAVARVRFLAPEGVNAADVRIFFRMWTTGWTALEYNLNTSYRRHGVGPSATPLLGLRGGEINNVPCFAEPRVANMEQQTDGTNRRTLQGRGAQEVHAYFGCWLDVNQDVARFPLEPQGNGPFPDEGDRSDPDDPTWLRSIQQLLLRGLHQCLVAEIHYQLDPIQSGATPGSSDNLAQRNILFDFSDNPGGFAAHLVHHTFELEPSPISFADSVLASTISPSTHRRLHPDELVIDWGELPRDSLVTFYIPQLDSDEIVRAAAVRQTPANLRAIAPGTLKCKVTDVGFMPIPGPFEKTLAGLVSVQLPPGVPSGKTYRVVLRQVEGRSYKVLGTTEFRIQVSNAEVLLPRFLHDLAVLKHIALSIPGSNRWHPVFKRYLEELGDRIRAFGGDPDAVNPSPHGTGSVPKRPEEDHGPKTSTGKVSRLFYDCFGAFEGFELRDCDKCNRFVSCDRGIERVALTACREDLKLTVVYDPATYRPKRLFLQCCSFGKPGRVDES